MAVNCPIPTKQQNDIDLSPVHGHAHAPFDLFVSLKRSKMFKRASQPEDGGSPHVPMRVAESGGQTATLTRNLPTKRYCLCTVHAWFPSFYDCAIQGPPPVLSRNSCRTASHAVGCFYNGMWRRQLQHNT